MATTQWSQVLAAKDRSDTEARAALESLCQTYWQPLYSYIRHQGADPEAAKDLTQSYFAELLGKNLLNEVDPAKGRFRAYLLATLRHHLSHERVRARAKKRGGGARTISMNVEAGEVDYQESLAEKMTPADVFERRWAMTVLNRAATRVRQESTALRREQWVHLRPYLLSGEPPEPYEKTAAKLGMSPSGVRSVVHRLRKRLGMCLREELAETVSDPSEVDDEIRHLLAVLRP
jgi:RNA polymerase sigma-70 factor (ECF subfamily)